MTEQGAPSDASGQIAGLTAMVADHEARIKELEASVARKKRESTERDRVRLLRREDAAERRLAQKGIGRTTP